MIFWKKTNVKRSVYVNTILRFFFFDDSIGIFMRYPCFKIMSVFDITLWRNDGVGEVQFTALLRP